MLDNIGSTFASIFPDTIATVLGKPLLWTTFNDEVNKLLDDNMIDRVKADVSHSNCGEAVV